MIEYESNEAADQPSRAGFERRDDRAVQAVVQILVNRFDIPAQDVQLDRRLVDDLGIEVLDLTDLVLALEEAFEIDISLAQAAGIVTVGDAVRCASSK
jgi:acyl carrier protein